MAEKVSPQNAVVRFYRETLGELRKVSWPTRDEAIHLTIVVLIVLVAMALLLGIVDWAGFQGLRWLIQQ